MAASFLFLKYSRSKLYALFFSRFYLFVHERHRERQRHRQREKQAPHRVPDVGLNPGSPGSHPGLKVMLNCWATQATPIVCVLFLFMYLLIFCQCKCFRLIFYMSAQSYLGFILEPKIWVLCIWAFFFSSSTAWVVFVFRKKRLSGDMRKSWIYSY